MERLDAGQSPTSKPIDGTPCWEETQTAAASVASFKFSTDPHFVAKLRDVTGLYLNPPDKAIVPSVDGKAQIQALDRTRPILPLRPELPERQRHDYRRHGTTTLFAALNVVEGAVIGECQPRHRHQELLLFLDRIEASVRRHLVKAIREYIRENWRPRPFHWEAKPKTILQKIERVKQAQKAPVK